MRNFMILTAHEILFGWSVQEEGPMFRKWHVERRGEEVRAGILKRSMSQRGHLEDLEVDGWTILKWTLKNRDVAYGLDSSK